MFVNLSYMDLKLEAEAYQVMHIFQLLVRISFSIRESIKFSIVLQIRLFYEGVYYSSNPFFGYFSITY